MEMSLKLYNFHMHFVFRISSQAKPSQKTDSSEIKSIKFISYFSGLIIRFTIRNKKK